MIAPSAARPNLWNSLNVDQGATVATITIGALYVLMMPMALVWMPTIGMALVIVMLSALAFGAASVGGAIIQRRMRRRRADVYVVNHIAGLLHQLRRAPRAWSYLNWRRGAARIIDAAVTTILAEIPKQVRFSDPETTLMLHECCRDAACRLRTLRHAVTWPMADSQQYVKNSLCDALECILMSNWHGLTNLEVPLTKRIEIPKRSRGRLVSQAIVTILPLALLSLLKFFDIALPTNLEPAVILAVYVWTIVGIVLSLDPSLKERLSLVSDTIALMAHKR